MKTFKIYETHSGDFSAEVVKEIALKRGLDTFSLDKEEFWFCQFDNIGNSVEVLFYE